ncbi:NAD(P)/FAD-dependent oxidoreductase [Almyronema epifaneia]|uniref:NAD(P)/FAD-dependent oxidoreductase n=1 Tax=Almyronema epifaneia S1 TaxID=2991925 RepID=A0ABW6IAF9_9CYAN
MTEIVVVGAGLAGLVCAQQLAQAGYRVSVLEKSRGLGGRLATRRLQNTCADQGTRSLQADSELLRSLIAHLVPIDILQPWSAQAYRWQAQQLVASQSSAHYSAPQGITAVAKFLAKGLTIQRQCRVIALSREADTWQLQIQTPDAVTALTAKVVVLAIPAPQALDLLKPLRAEVVSTDAIAALEQIRYWPCLSVIAGYPPHCFGQFGALPLPGWWVEFTNDADLAWVGLESSKRPEADFPLIVLQSSTAFAQAYGETTDLLATGKQLLQSAAGRILPWLSQPDWLQGHRWRYGFVAQPQVEPLLTLAADPWLLICGDGHGGAGVTAALQSGFATADSLNQQLEQRSLLAPSELWQHL